MGYYNLFPAWTVQCGLCKALRSFPNEAAANEYLKTDMADFPHYEYCPHGKRTEEKKQTTNGQ